MKRIELMLPKGKPPLFGIVYEDNTTGGFTNTDLVDLHRDKEFKIVVEVAEKDINIRLICEAIVNVRFYNHMRFDPEQLRSWIYVVEVTKAPLINFCHLVYDGKNFKLAQSHKNKNFVLKVVNFQLLVRKGVGHLKRFEF